MQPTPLENLKKETNPHIRTLALALHAAGVDVTVTDNAEPTLLDDCLITGVVNQDGGELSVAVPNEHSEYDDPRYRLTIDMKNGTFIHGLKTNDPNAMVKTILDIKGD